MKMMCFPLSNPIYMTPHPIAAHFWASATQQHSCPRSHRARKRSAILLLLAGINGCRNVFTVTATSYDSIATITAPQVTIYTTESTTALVLQKRQDTASATNPVVLAISGASINATIAASVYSVCSCLNLKPSIVVTRSIIETVSLPVATYIPARSLRFTQTRTVDGIDYESVSTSTILSGTTTIIITASASAYPTLHPNITHTASPSSSEPVISGNGTFSSTGALGLTGLLSGTGSLPTKATTRTVFVSTNTSQLATGTPRVPYFNLTAPPLNLTVPTILPTGLPTSGLSTAASALFPKANATTSSTLPLATSIGHGGCPNVNNTIFTTSNSQDYQIQCYREYNGPSLLGLQEPNFLACINECDTVNAGFSQLVCFGVTWTPYVISGGIKCNLKDQTGLGGYTSNPLAASAVLLTGVPPPVVGAW